MILTTRQRNRIGEISSGYLSVVHAGARAISSPRKMCAVGSRSIGRRTELCLLGKPLLAWLAAALTPQIQLLTITPEVAADSATLPHFPNKDPYDQIIVATARQSNLTIISNDDAWKNYPVAKILYFKPSAPKPA